MSKIVSNARVRGYASWMLAKASSLAWSLLPVFVLVKTYPLIAEGNLGGGVMTVLTVAGFLLSLWVILGRMDYARPTVSLSKEDDYYVLKIERGGERDTHEFGIRR